MGLEGKLNGDGFLVTQLDAVVAWARKNSVYPRGNRVFWYIFYGRLQEGDEIHNIINCKVLKSSLEPNR